MGAVPWTWTFEYDGTPQVLEGYSKTLVYVGPLREGTEAKVEGLRAFVDSALEWR